MTVASSSTLPSSVDLSHHLSSVAKSRSPSPLKEIIKYMAKLGMISLAGGLPHPSFFPITSLNATAYPSSTVLDTTSPSSPTDVIPLSVPLRPSPSSPFAISQSLQYSNPAGHLSLLDFAQQLTAKLHTPLYSDYTTLLNCGSTDGWSKVCTLLLEPGDYVLVEEQIYPSAQAAYIPLGCKGVVIGVDGEGARADLLEKTLASWDEQKGRRPHVMYIVPVGQNPLGSTMQSKRRKEIYDVCVKYDVIIVEDDPYTMLQFGPYSPDTPSLPASKDVDVDGFINAMEKSFLQHDYQGRVIRLETFSKTIAPGSRLGWFVSNSMFAERLLRGTEVQTQHPSGFSQMVVGQLLNEWGINGFLEWTTNLKEQYRVRRDWMLDAMSSHFDLVPAEKAGVKDALGVVAFRKGNRQPLLSFVPPLAGMFLWCDVYYSSNPSFQALTATGREDPESDYERTFWEKLNDANVLVTPGWYYRPWQGEEYKTTESRGGRVGELLGLKSRWVEWRGDEWQSESPQWTNEEQEVVSAKTNGRIVVTGGGGNIGKLLIRRLLSSHTPITVLDLIFHPDELEAIHEDLPQASSLLTVIHGDIRDEEILDEALTSDVVGVIHLAAVSRVGWCLENERDCEDVNVRGTDVVLSALERRVKGGWFIQASSREVYGNAKTFPVTEDTPNTPANAYGSTKSDAEKVIYQHAEESNLHAILLRLSNVYGGLADHHERLIPAIMTNALSHRPIQIVGGNQDLDMVHIDDVVDAFTLAVNHLESTSSSDASSVEVFNVGTGTSTPALELIRKVLALTNSSSPMQTIPGDDRFPDHYIGSTTKAKEVLGYQSRVSQDEGLLRLTVAFMYETLLYTHRKIQNDCQPKIYGIADLTELDGCTGTVGVDGPSGMEYLNADRSTESAPKFEWRDEDEPQVWTFEVKSLGGGQASVRFGQDVKGAKQYFESTPEGHLLGVDSRFTAEVEKETGYVNLLIDDKPVVPPHISSVSTRYRLTPFCCPNKAAPWPFFKEDPLASAISDQRLEKYRYFNASRVITLCERLHKARDVVHDKWTKLRTLTPPLHLEEAPLPAGEPFDWRLRTLDTCTNLCDHPTVCLDTGDCACALGACSSRIRYPFTAFANVPSLSYPPPTIHWDELAMYDPDVLIKQVAQSSWFNVLRPPARRYLQGKPNFPSINLTRLPDEIQSDRDDYPGDFDKVQSTPHGCFSADSVMERGVKALSQQYSKDSLVFMPYFAGTKMMPPVEPWIQNALDHNLPSDFDPTGLIVPFTFDWGVCNTVLRNLFRVRDWSSVAPQMERISSWQPMGDLNSPCESSTARMSADLSGYRADQDIVIPARTCLQDKLRERFGDLADVRPCRQRSILVAFKGSLAGAGTSLRQKVACERPFTHIAEPQLVGGTTMRRYWNEMKPGADYMETIGDTVFCPVPRGTTGWATRTIDVIYAGCIPVLLGDQTHHPFWDMLDWNKFSVQINDQDIDHLERILLDYTWGDVQRMQTNLMLIRDAFLYPSEDDIEGNLRDRGPFFFAMHGTALLRQTKYPV
ncbi:hypothetical protein IAR55_006381 [Kwoniella newhampshirensis]|uniref:Exostosin GT47 domain-containing protein n=1 Tax=Kwoniella newhampshirensis TaxID=1651941 RepID=A0AAW0YE05_9TREE